MRKDRNKMAIFIELQQRVEIGLSFGHTSIYAMTTLDRDFCPLGRKKT